MAVRAPANPGPAVATADLIEALEPQMGRSVHDASGIASINRIPSKFSTSFPIEDIEVGLASGRRLKLIFKDLSPQSLLAGAAATRPGFVFHPMREIQMYRNVLCSETLGTPVFLGAVADESRSRYWLFLERVPGVELFQVEDPATWADVAAWLGKTHDHLQHETENEPTAPLLEYDLDWYRRWMRRAEGFTGRLQETHRIAEAYRLATRRLGELPATLIHGDFYASNVLLSPQPSTMRICPVDWERAARGPGMIDLAALTMGWGPSESEQLADAYARNNRFAGSLSRQQRRRDLDCCSLHLCVQWLGWSPHWTPPEEHRQDWFARALMLADGLLDRAIPPARV